MKKPICAFLLILLSMKLLSAVNPFAKWTKTELILDNGIVTRTIKLPSTGGNYMTVSYKPVSGNFNYFLNNLTDFQFEVNDIIYSGNGNWSLSDITNISDSKEGNGAAVNLISQDEKVKLTIRYLLYPNSPAIRKSLIVNNLTDKPVRLESVDVEKLEVPGYNPVTFSWIYHDYGRRRFIGPYEGGKQDALIIVHNMNLEQGVVIGNEATGVMKHTSVFWETQDICVGLTHKNALFPFRKWIEKGESFETPQVFTMVYNNQKTPDQMLNIAVPDFVRKHMGIRLSELKEKPTFVYNTWEPFLKNINEKLVIELAKAAADAGMKEFVIDDGWQDSYGDWGIDMKKFPNGLKPVFDYIKSLGMKPGLWVSIGSAAPSSKVYKAHPEWFVLDRNGDHTSLHAPNDKEKFTACFGTVWYDYIKAILLKLAVDYGLEYFKLDFAVVTSAYTYDHTQSGCYSTTHPGHKDHNESLFTNYESLWRLFDELHAAKPNLFIDCTFETLGGTQLIDYALLKHAEGDWLSNFEGNAGEKTDIRIRNMAWWRSPAIPATTLVIGNPQMQDKDWEMHIKSIAGALPIMLGDPRKLSESDLKKYRGYADWLQLMENKYGIMSYRQDLPGFGEPMEGMWDGFQRINSDTKSGGIIGVFRHGSVEKNRIITVKWLDPAKTYNVKSMNGNVVATLTGSDLQTKGFSLSLEGYYSGDVFEISVSGNNSIDVQSLSDKPLRVLADKAGLLVGVRAFLKDDAQKKIVGREFNTSTRTCYPNSIDRSPGQHDLESFNTGVNWLYERGMKPMHHMLFGPSQYEAAWVREITSVSRLDSLMKERIRTIMESNDNGSKVNVWNVVNEALSWNKEDIGNYFTADKVVWVRMGYEDDKSGLTGDDRINARHPVFIRKAFEYASKYARGKLELRETGCETPNRKSQALYQLVRHLQNSGVKIDGVGLQCHYNIEGEGVLDSGGLATVIRKFRSTGVEMYLTEVDFGRRKVLWTPELAEKQKQEYKKLITIALEEGVSQVHFWGLRDADENWRGDENPLLFDENLNPKPAYYGVREALMKFLEKGSGQRPEQDAVKPGEDIEF